MRTRRARTAGACILVALCAALAGAASAADSREPVFADFADIGAWRVAASDDVKASLRPAPGPGGGALCLDFDFGNVSGYVALGRDVALDFQGNFEFAFSVRSDVPGNALQFKLVDASGDNVWWADRPDFGFTGAWQPVRIARRQISFAWGPTPDRELRHSSRVELVIARGRDGGKGSFCISALSLRALPDATPPSPTGTSVSSSSTLAPSRPQLAFDGDTSTAWRSDPGAGREQSLTLDFGAPREFGSLTLDWEAGLHASRYEIALSADNAQWHTARSVVDGNGGVDPIWLPDATARYVRLRMLDGPRKAYALREMRFGDPALGESRNRFLAPIAAAAPRGHYPRAWRGEQAYWTIVGIDGGRAQLLLSEDGAIELGTRAASIEPFLLTAEGLVTWADAEVSQSLADGYLPIPTVTWKKGDLGLRITAFATGDRDHAQAIARYVVENRSARAQSLTLALAARPFQVNPPTQFLNTPGGVAPIHDVALRGNALVIDGHTRLIALRLPEKFIALDLDRGEVADALLQPPVGADAVAHDATGLASGILLYPLRIPPGAARGVDVVVPLTGAPALPRRNAQSWADNAQAEAARLWRAKLNLVPVGLPASQARIGDALRTALAHILISRDGAVLRPGTRAYARSWIRDGTMMSEALLRLGHGEIARDYASWYAERQFSNGKIPCCVDDRGADPVAENDSQGEFVHLVSTIERYLPNSAWLARMWKHAAAALGYMDALAEKERTPANREPDREAYFGLMPPSISHEGYSDKPAYAYWDDFWSLAGYAGGVRIATALDRDDVQDRIARRDEFAIDLEASLQAAMRRHGIDYLPASADRGDFDPTATTIALSSAGAQSRLPPAALHATFERYWAGFVARRDGKDSWDAFTPYELRAIGAFVRLGWRDRAAQALDYFLSFRRPSAWNQWAEVVGREARQPRFIGDMPHAWIASDFIQAALDMFAYERAQDESMVLAAGVPTAWLRGKGVSIRDLRTPYGTIGYRLRRAGDRLVLALAGSAGIPPGGFVFPWPYATPPGPVLVNGRKADWSAAGELVIHSLPATIEIAVSKATRD